MSQQEETASLTTMVSEGAIVVDDFAQVKAGEKVTIVTDSSRRQEAEIVCSICQSCDAEAVVVDISPYVMPVKTGRYVDPPEHVRELFKSSNVTIVVTSQEYSQRLSHALANFMEMTETCDVYHVDEGIGNWDYSKEDINLVMERCEKMMEAMKDTEWVRVTSSLGTDLKLNIKDRDCLPVMPIMPRGSVPTATPGPLWGELNYAPVENLTEGKVVVDGILMRGGSEAPINGTVEWIVEEGRIVDVSGGQEAEEFKKTLEAADDNAYVIGELGLGGSHKARLGTMEEKGHLGTVHLGVGNNKGVYPGGQNVSEIHGDGSVRNAVVEIDGEKIIEDNTLLI